MRETKNTEFKETLTNTFLKTVSAFANYNGGVIYFGVDDQGNIKGLPEIRQACLAIENKINDSITPQPDYTLEILNDERVIRLTVKSGPLKPYLYKAKAYKRNDTATIEADTLELTRLILEGKNLSFEELPCKVQELTFNVLGQKFKKHVHIDSFNLDTLKTLNLYNNDSGYNNAAGILADHSPFPGIDMVKFGADISIIQKRATFSQVSALTAFAQALSIYRDYYQYEEVTGSNRIKVNRIPEESFREAIANALIHRTWDVDAPVKVALFDDRIEITSPGGLPSGISEEEYLAGNLSILRNKNLANVFYRLGFVEIFGTGIPRIRQVYAESLKQPLFKISENSLQIVLPVVEKNLDLSDDERKIYGLLSRQTLKSISDIKPNTAFGKTKITQLLKKLMNRGLVITEGNGRGTKYRLK